MTITIITDNNQSWFIDYGEVLKSKLIANGHEVEYVFDKNDIKAGDVCFILSCSKIIGQKYLDKNQHNIVVHASDLPLGKGFSPLQWQILEGKNIIPLTLFEAVEGVDAGPYYLKKSVNFNGTELHDELRKGLAEKIIEMCLEFVENYQQMSPIEQSGEETFYERRTEKDDEINPEKSIAELFNHFRIADNTKYPLYFTYKNKKYTIKVDKIEN